MCIHHRIAKLRAKQRSEERKLQGIKNQATKAKSSQGLLDLNTATEKELQSIKGIGPKKLEKIRAYVVVGKGY
ncbi:MAG: helix-hairpin-helix domain-containing protein [Candidatus Desulfofervidus sp.]|nr:helix-hairpin-helix domain-containing protein [Candidatus Desulfofervidus sp.]